jgi:VanZ family protein
VKGFLKTHAPALAWAILIFIVSSIPRLHPPDLGFHAQDKLAHAAEYGIFGWLLLRSFRALTPKHAKAVFLVLFLGSVYAASDELHQLFVPGRRADVFDFLADAAGLALSQLILQLTVRRHRAAGAEKSGSR